jgi:transposase
MNKAKMDGRKLGGDSAQVSSDRLRAVQPANIGTPDPEVVETPSRRKFTAEYKLRILREVDQCTQGEIGALLRREGLYRSHLSKWREQRARAEEDALAPKQRGRKSKGQNPLASRLAELERENERLKRRLQQAETVIEVQKKISEILQIPLTRPDRDESN